MTDAILLAETHSDRELLAYEPHHRDSHERTSTSISSSGYVKRLVVSFPS